MYVAHATPGTAAIPTFRRGPAIRPRAREGLAITANPGAQGPRSDRMSVIFRVARKLAGKLVSAAIIHWILDAI